MYLERNDAFERGKGCVHCGTAVPHEISCETCKSLFITYLQNGKSLDGLTGKYHFLCDICLETYLKKQKLKYKKGISVGKIPGWRLNMEDLSPDEVLTKSGTELGMPAMSNQKWQEYYSSDHETKRAKEFQTQQQALKAEIGSLVIED